MYEMTWKKTISQNSRLSDVGITADLNFAQWAATLLHKASKAMKVRDHEDENNN